MSSVPTNFWQQVVDYMQANPNSRLGQSIEVVSSAGFKTICFYNPDACCFYNDANIARYMAEWEGQK